jgi:hypothetical protein
MQRTVHDIVQEMLAYEADAFDNDEEVSGADLVEAFAEWRVDLQAALSAKAARYVVIYDTGDTPGEDVAEEYYGYFADVDDAKRMFDGMRGDNAAIHNAYVAQLVEAIPDVDFASLDGIIAEQPAYSGVTHADEHIPDPAAVAKVQKKLVRVLLKKDIHRG